MRNLFGMATVLLALFAALLARPANAQQMADPGFDARVARPAFPSKHPKLLFDEAHRNFHTTAGSFRPFAALMRNDGYDVIPGTQPFSADILAGTQILVIVNALGAQVTNEASSPAFTDVEADAVRDWVRDGGSLLLVADHAPFGAAAMGLARRFGVDLGGGYVFDPNPRIFVGEPTALSFSRVNGLLGDGPILDGRSPDEVVRRVVSFTGESLSIPPRAVVLLKLGQSARKSPNRTMLINSVNPNAPRDTAALQSKSAAGLAQGLALKFGQGRIAIFGDAEIFSAQVMNIKQGSTQREIRAGMNTPGNDDRQLVLNVMHWLSGLLP